MSPIVRFFSSRRYTVNNFIPKRGTRIGKWCLTEVAITIASKDGSLSNCSYLVSVLSSGYRPCKCRKRSSFTSQIDFNWQTSCDQLGFNQNCRTFSNVYHFVFKFTDDFCPIPGISTATVTIVILPPPLVKPPKIHCVEVLPSGDVKLTWDQPVDTANAFNRFTVFYSSNPNGPFNYVDTVGKWSSTITIKSFKLLEWAID